jgi:histidinol dehydrogenase
VHGAHEARRSLLCRSSLEVQTLPNAVREVIRKVFGAELDVAVVVEQILRDVRSGGDDAVRRYNREIDGVREHSSSASLEVSRQEIERAHKETDKTIIDALKQAAKRIRSFHEKQLERSLRAFHYDGVGQVVRPIARVGFYVPGTKAIYPSTVLMSVIPARAAGVSEVVMCTPADENSKVAALKLVAAEVAGVDRVFKAGGAQGIGAMAFGTETIPRVNKICGPGNIFVTLAKKQLFGEVGIDGIFGPSETLVIADSTAEARLVAADLMAGAEHDELATAVLLTDSETLAQQVAELIEGEIELLARASVARASLDAHGGVVVVGDIEDAIELANEFAPEHLCLHVADADAAAQRVRNAGCVFIGAHSVESIGDYTAGPSHVMPTGGSAAYSSPLGVHDFLKVMSVVKLDSGSLNAIGPAAAAIAKAEGLTGHARAVESRLQREGS